MKSYCTLPSRATRVSIWSLSGRWPRNSVVPGSEGWSLAPLRLKARVLPSGRAARAVECTTWRVEAALATAMHWLCTLDGLQGEVDPAAPIFLVPYARAQSQQHSSSDSRARRSCVHVPKPVHSIVHITFTVTSLPYDSPDQRFVARNAVRWCTSRSRALHELRGAPGTATATVATTWYRRRQRRAWWA